MCSACDEMISCRCALLGDLLISLIDLSPLPCILSSKDKHGETPLHKVARNGWDNVLQVMLDRSDASSVILAFHIRDLEGSTVIDSAVACDSILSKSNYCKKDFPRNNKLKAILDSATTLHRFDRIATQHYISTLGAVAQNIAYAGHVYGFIRNYSRREIPLAVWKPDHLQAVYFFPPGSSKGNSLRLFTNV